MRILATFTGLLITFVVFTCNFVQAKDTTHLGHNYPRQVVANKAKESNAQVGKKYKALLNLIKRSDYTGDDEHIAETVMILEDDQKRWLAFRNTHCQLQANVYVYPSDSRMWASQYNYCELDMNKKRIKFINDISYEYKK